MKKAVQILILILLPSLLFALEEGTGSDTGNPADGPVEASTLVSLDLSGTGDAYVELYFLRSNDISDPENNRQTSVALSFKNDEPVATNSGADNQLYAYWKIVSGLSLEIDFKLSGDLKNTTVTNDIGKGIVWTASWANASPASSNGISLLADPADSDHELTSGGVDTEASKLIGRHPDESNSLESDGLRVVTLSTDPDTDFTAFKPGVYEAYLYLVCKTKQ